jgi:uncharacterized hydantoinase/oxoprolinase family protein
MRTQNTTTGAGNTTAAQIRKQLEKVAAANWLAMTPGALDHSVKMISRRLNDMVANGDLRSIEEQDVYEQVNEWVGI